MVKLAVRKPAQSPGGAPTETLVGAGYTNAQGEFAMRYTTPLTAGQELVIQPMSPHFLYLPVVVPIATPQFGTYDIGSHTGMALTYRLQVNLVDSAGKAVPNAAVKIARPASFYASSIAAAGMKPEFGGGPASKQLLPGSFSSQQMAADVVDSGKHGGVFGAAFFAPSLSERYTLILSAPGGIAHTTDLQIAPPPVPALSTVTSGAYGAGPLIVQTYVVNTGGPQVRGRVLSDPGDVPLGGAQAVVHPAGTGALIALQFGQAFSALTTIDGRFTVTPVRPASGPYRLTIILGGKLYPQDGDFTLTSGAATVNRDPVRIGAVTVPVCGMVRNGVGQTVPGAVVQWKSGGPTVSTDGAGMFFTAQTIGRHTLMVRKTGYRDAEMEVEVGAGATKYDVGTPDAMWAKAQSASPFSNSTSAGTYNLATAGYAASSSVGPARSFYNQLFGNAPVVGIPKSAPAYSTVVTLDRFVVRVRVESKLGNELLPGASVRIEGSTAAPVPTNAAGIAFLRGGMPGTLNIIVEPAAGTDYATTFASVTAPAGADTVQATVKLKAGTTASGTVTSGGAGVVGAEVVVVGQEYIRTVTGSGGAYTLRGIPAATRTLRATRTGALGAEVERDFEAGRPQQINFTLSTSTISADKILGFPVVLTAVRAGAAAGEFIISGSITAVPGNTTFKPTVASTRLNFTDETVIQKPGGVVEPKGGILTLDASETAVKLFDFAAVTAKGKSGALRLRAAAGTPGRGEIVGTAKLQTAGTFSTPNGWTAPGSALDVTAAGADEIVLFTSDAVAPRSSYTLAAVSGYKLYSVDFTPAAGGVQVDKNGITMQGTIATPGQQGVPSKSLTVTKAAISTSGELGAVDISTNPKPQLEIGMWVMGISAAVISQYGLKLGGDLNLPSKIAGGVSWAVSNMNMAQNSISGALAQLPTSGFPVLGVLQCKTPKPFSISSAGSNVFKLTVNEADLHLNSPIDRDVPIKSFSVSTNGAVEGTVKTGFTADVGDLAKFSITSLGFATSPTGANSISVGGAMKLNLPMCGASAATSVQFSKTGWKIDTMRLGFSLAQHAAVKVHLTLGENRFLGRGALRIGTLDSIGISFNYAKLQNGIEVGAGFNLPQSVMLPIGPIRWNSISGGFSYNNAEGRYKVEAGGKLAFIADAADLVTLSPFNVSVTMTPGGPIFDGAGSVAVRDKWKMSQAAFTLDIPERFFSISAQVGRGFDLMKGIKIDTFAQVSVQANAKAPFAVFAFNSKVTIPFLAKSSAVVAGGWNAPKAGNAALSDVPNYALTDGRIYGGFVRVAADMGVKQSQAPWIGLWNIASVRAWFANRTYAEIHANFKGNNYGLRLGQNWECGAQVDLWGFSVVTVAADFDGSLGGSFGGSAWNLSGNLAGNIRAHAGCDGGCNKVNFGGCFDACAPLGFSCQTCPVPCGAKVCAKGDVNVGYSPTSGPTFSYSYSKD